MIVMKKRFIGLTLSGMLLVAPLAFAGGGHDHDHGHKDDDHAHESGGGHDDHGGMSDKGMFLVEREIDGYEVSFHVMKAQAGMEHGGSHNLMVKVEQGDKTLGDVKINSKVVYPNGESDSKPLMKMGDWYMNGYDLGDAGKHQLLILFKTADGEKHKGGVFYSGQ